MKLPEATSEELYRSRRRASGTVTSNWCSTPGARFGRAISISITRAGCPEFGTVGVPVRIAWAASGKALKAGRFELAHYVEADDADLGEADAGAEAHRLLRG